jgi:hypothetical protein
MHAKWALSAGQAFLQNRPSTIGKPTNGFHASSCDEKKQHFALKEIAWHKTCFGWGCSALGERANYKTNGSLAMGEVANEPFVFLWEEFQ